MIHSAGGKIDLNGYNNLTGLENSEYYLDCLWCLMCCRCGWSTVHFSIVTRQCCLCNKQCHMEIPSCWGDLDKEEKKTTALICVYHFFLNFRFALDSICCSSFSCHCKRSPMETRCYWVGFVKDQTR